MLNREFKIAIVVSVILHILAMAFFQYAGDLLMLAADNAAPIEVFLQQPDGGWQIADIPRPYNEQRPARSKFIGMYDQSVKEETVAKSQSKPEAGSRKPEAKKQKPKNLYKFDENMFAMKSPFAEERNEVSSGAPEGSRAVIPEDFYPDFKYGEHTYLNVLRYPDVEYFVRLKRIFKVTWNPVSALRQDMQSTSVSRGSVSVILAVAVDKKGDLSELFILRSSGLPHYDSEAVRTVRASSPFSAPPEKLLEKEGTLRMSWTFVVYL